MTTIVTTINIYGDVSTRVISHITCESDVMKWLRVDKLGPMDSIEAKTYNDKFVVTVRIAQKEPWTFMTYIFVQ